MTFDFRSYTNPIVDVIKKDGFYEKMKKYEAILGKRPQPNSRGLFNEPPPRKF